MSDYWICWQSKERILKISLIPLRVSGVTVFFKFFIEQNLCNAIEQNLCNTIEQSQWFGKYKLLNLWAFEMKRIRVKCTSLQPVAIHLFKFSVWKSVSKWNQLNFEPYLVFASYVQESFRPTWGRHGLQRLQADGNKDWRSLLSKPSMGGRT